MDAIPLSVVPYPNPAAPLLHIVHIHHIIASYNSPSCSFICKPITCLLLSNRDSHISGQGKGTGKYAASDKFRRVKRRCQLFSLPSLYSQHYPLSRKTCKILHVFVFVKCSILHVSIDFFICHNYDKNV